MVSMGTTLDRYPGTSVSEDRGAILASDRRDYATTTAHAVAIAAHHVLRININNNNRYLYKHLLLYLLPYLVIRIYSA